MKKLAIITTHPIQYNAPWFRLLSERGIIRIKVFYTWSQSSAGEKYDPGFQRNIAWDIPLLDGYDHEFVENTSSNPGTRHYNGIVNPGLISTIKDFQPDAVLVNGWKFNSHLKCMRYFRKQKVPVLFRGDSTLLDESSGWKAIFRRMALTAVFRNIDKALYVGAANKAYFLKHGIRPDKLYFTPHAIDNARFTFSPAHEEKALLLRKELGVKDEELLVLFAGKLEPKKDPQLLLDAFKEAELSNVKLVFVGNGVLEESLKSQAKNYTNISFLDFQNQLQMPAIYAMADLVVLPSRGPGETWGLAVNEAMAAGKAVLVSDACGCADDLVSNSFNGLIFRSKNKDELKNKLIILCESREKLKELGTNGAKKIKNFSFEKIAEGIEAAVK